MALPLVEWSTLAARQAGFDVVAVQYGRGSDGRVSVERNRVAAPVLILKKPA